MMYLSVVVHVAYPTKERYTCYIYFSKGVYDLL